MFHISILVGLELCLGGLSLPKPPRGDGTGSAAQNLNVWPGARFYRLQKLEEMTAPDCHSTSIKCCQIYYMILERFIRLCAVSSLSPQRCKCRTSACIWWKLVLFGGRNENSDVKYYLDSVNVSTKISCTSSHLYLSCGRSSPVTSLGHQGGRRVFWKGPNLLNYVQHIFPRGAKNFPGGACPP